MGTANPRAGNGGVKRRGSCVPGPSLLEVAAVATPQGSTAVLSTPMPRIAGQGSEGLQGSDPGCSNSVASDFCSLSPEL